MTSTQMKEKAETHPFVPFRIQMSDGAQYDVTSTTEFVVLSSAFGVAVDRDPADGLARRMVYLDPHHITRVEDLARTTPSSNGRPKKPKK